MNKRNKQLVPLCFLIAIVIFVAILFTMIGNSYEEFKNIKDSKVVLVSQYDKAKQEYDKSAQQLKSDEMQMQSIKPVYEATSNSDSENLGVFGSMFEDIIKIVQSNGLLIRSLEYDMRPAEDQVFINYTESYNVCELKFFIVGTYTQLKTFLKEITGNNFQYLVSISKLNVTAFNGNPDYILANVSITLYAKKPGKRPRK